jgi:hypothetical protein
MPKTITHKHIILKLQKTKNKGKILKDTQGEGDEM